MVKRKYAVVGASGQIGSRVAEYLVKKGHQVKAIGRNEKKLEPLQAKGVEIALVEGFDNQPLFEKNFKDVDGVFLMIPPGYTQEDLWIFQDRIGEVLAGAVRNCGVKAVVNLSSLGANLPNGVGPITGLHRQEERLSALPNVDVVHLRPAYFMQNFLWAIPGLLQTGVLRSPINPEMALPIVSTDDVGLKAAELLDQLNFKGHTVCDYVGPRTVTMPEAAAILGKAIDQPDLKYNAQSLEEVRRDMIRASTKPQVIDVMIEMYAAFNAGKCLPTQKLTPDQHGKTTLEEFAKIFAVAYKSQAEKQTVHR